MMKTPRPHKSPVRSLLKNLFNQGGQTNKQDVPDTKLPAPQPITTDMTITAEQQPETNMTVSNVISETLDMSPVPTEAITPPPTTQSDTNSALHQVLSKVIAEVPECKALAYVDIQQNILLGIATAQPLPEAIEPLVAAATSDLFNAPNVIKIANLFKEHKGLQTEQSNFNGITVHGDSDIYVFIRAQNHQHRVAVFSCRNSVTFGSILRNAQLVMPQIEMLDI